MSKSKDAEATPEVEPDDVAAEVAEAAEAAEDPASTPAAAEAETEDEAEAPDLAAAPDGDDAADAEIEAEAAADDDAAGAPEGPFMLHRRARLEETEALLAWLRAAPVDAPMELDASEVENVSTPYILAIVGAARARAEAGSPAAVRSPSPAFVDAFSDLGLFGDLMKMEIRP